MRLTALIDALPPEPANNIPSKTSAADLIALLPKSKTPNVRPSENMFAGTRLRQTQMLVAFGAFAIMMLIVFTMSALFSPGPGVGANPTASRAADAAMTPPRKLDP